MKGKLLARFSLCSSFFHVYEVSISCLNRTIRVRVYFFIELLNSTVELFKPISNQLTIQLLQYTLIEHFLLFILPLVLKFALKQSHQANRTETSCINAFNLFSCQLENVSDCNVSTVSRHKYPFLFIRRFCFIMKIKH